MSEVHLAVANHPQLVAGGNIAQDDAFAAVQRTADRGGRGHVREADDDRAAVLPRKGDGKRHRHDDRKHEGPENRLGFPHPLAKPCQGQLDDRRPDVSRLHEGACR